MYPLFFLAERSHLYSAVVSLDAVDVIGTNLENALAEVILMIEWQGEMRSFRKGEELWSQTLANCSAKARK